jgi:hypothetical protein
MRVAFLSEGATELAFAPGARADEAWRHSFLLKTIVERILGAPGRIEAMDDADLPCLRGNAVGLLCRKAAGFIRQCVWRRAEGVIVVVDRDRTGPQRLKDLLDQREQLRQDRSRPLAVPVAVGVAIETIEAWLLADEVALCDELGLPRPSEPGKSPEKLDGKPGEPTHPKHVLSSYLRKDTRGTRTFLEQVNALAACMDLDVVARRCPEGFGRFRDDVLSEFGLHLSRA